MVNKRNLIVVALVTFCLAVTLFSIIPRSSSQGVHDYNPWLDINDDGGIDGSDLIQLARAFGATGDPINKTALLYDVNATFAELLSRIDSSNASLVELQGRVMKLENGMIPLNDTVLGLVSKVDDLNASLLDLVSRTTSLNASVIGLVSGVNSLNVSLLNVQDRVLSLEGRATSLETELHQLEGNVTILQANVDSLNNTVTLLSSTVATLQTNFAVMNATVSLLTAQMAILQSQMSAMNNCLTLVWQSQWRSLSAGENKIDFPFSMNTTDVFVYMEGKKSLSDNPHQIDYGGLWDDGLAPWHGAYWWDLTSTSITVHRHGNDDNWNYVRVSIWKTVVLKN